MRQEPVLCPDSHFVQGIIVPPNQTNFEKLQANQEYTAEHRHITDSGRLDIRTHVLRSVARKALKDVIELCLWQEERCGFLRRSDSERTAGQSNFVLELDFVVGFLYHGSRAQHLNPQESKSSNATCFLVVLHF
jgi:hypothetical protein